MISNTTVCIGFADALSAPEVSWSLIDAGYRVIAFIRKGQAAALRYSRHVSVFEIPAPELGIAESVRALEIELSQITRDARLVLFPLDDASVFLCARVGLGENMILAGADRNLAPVALDKKFQFELARKAGFNVIPTLSSDALDRMSEAKAHFPMIAKPRFAVEERCGRLLKENYDLVKDFSTFSNFRKEARSERLWQPYLTGGTGQGLFGLATEGGVIAWSAHRRIRMMNPSGSGSSACQAIRPDDAHIEYATRFVQISGWRGLFMIEMLRDNQGQVWFMEFNGRPWGSMALAKRQGVDYPAWAVEYALQGRFRSNRVDLKDGVVCRHLGREILHLMFVARGPKKGNTTEWPGFWRTFSELCTLDRSHCWYNWRSDDKKVFWGDVWLTVRKQLARG